MSTTCFNVSINKNITSHDYLLIKTLYLPIIGPTAVAIYSNLVELNDNSTDLINNKNPRLYQIADLTKTLALNNEDFVQARKLLEGLGLLQTYLSSDDQKMIFKVLPPLSYDAFFKNKLIFNLLKKQIGETKLDALLHRQKKPEIDFREFTNISVRFIDLFDFEVGVSEEKHLQTKEMSLPQFNSKTDALNQLTSTQFIKYLTGTFPSTNEIEKVTHFLELGFSDSALNLILDYSFITNKDIVWNFVSTIVYDMKNKAIFAFSKVQKHLNKALKFKDNNNNNQSPALKTNSNNLSTDEQVQNFLKDAFFS